MIKKLWEFDWVTAIGVGYILLIIIAIISRHIWEYFISKKGK